jgi:hypothetical protein
MKKKMAWRSSDVVTAHIIELGFGPCLLVFGHMGTVHASPQAVGPTDYYVYKQDPEPTCFLSFSLSLTHTHTHTLISLTHRGRIESERELETNKIFGRD